MKKKEIWWDSYRGIRFEVNKFEGMEKLDSWTFYLHLAVEQFPEEMRAKVKPFFYYTAFGTPIESPRENPLENLDWHGGLTWISEERQRPFNGIKVGCDYQHLWDQGQIYSVDEVARDAKKCIDSLFDYIPTLLTEEKLWEIHRAKFPGEAAGDVRMFDENIKPIPWN